MKIFGIAMASGLLLATPVFADSVTIQTNDNAGVAVSPPVAIVPAPTEQRTIEQDKVKESDNGMKREEKRTTETITPEGKSRTTTKIEQDNN